MSQQILSGKLRKVQPPEKGSFPLDHEGICKKSMLTYMVCLADNKYDNSKCREEAKTYLSCRMDNQLMAREDIEDLGFQNNNESNSANQI